MTATDSAAFLPPTSKDTGLLLLGATVGLLHLMALLRRKGTTERLPRSTSNLTSPHRTGTRRRSNTNLCRNTSRTGSRHLNSR